MPPIWEMAVGLLVLVSAVTDLTRGLVYNWITLPAMLLGLVLGLVHGGLSGLGWAALGILVGGGLMLLPFALGGMGGGDVKLLAAVGALAGPLFAFKTVLYACLAGGVLALGVLAQSGKLREGLAGLGRTLSGAFRPGRKAGPAPLGLPPLPFAVCIAAGAFCAARWDVLRQVLRP